MRRRILIVIPRLIAGGSEKVLTTIAKKLDRERFEVHVAVLSNESPDQLDVLPSHIALHRLNVSRARYAGFGLLRLIWKLHPHVVLAAGGVSGVLAVVTAKLARTPVIVRQGTMLAPSARRLQHWAQIGVRVEPAPCRPRDLPVERYGPRSCDQLRCRAAESALAF